MSELAEIIGKILEISPPRKIVSTHEMDCQQSQNKENLKTLILVFDDGYTEVRCPNKDINCVCNYGDRTHSSGKKKLGTGQYFLRGLIILVVFIILFIAVTFQIIIPLHEALSRTPTS